MLKLDQRQSQILTTPGSHTLGLQNSGDVHDIFNNNLLAYVEKMVFIIKVFQHASMCCPVRSNLQTNPIENMGDHYYNSIQTQYKKFIYLNEFTTTIQEAGMNLDLYVQMGRKL